MGNDDAATHVLPRNLDSFICACCPATVCIQLAYFAWAAPTSNVNVKNKIKKHLCSNIQGAPYRQQVHGLGFDKAAWCLYLLGERLGFWSYAVVNSRPAADMHIGMAVKYSLGKSAV